jgi:hypothetical protein
MPSPAGCPLSDDCPETYEHGKFMVTMGQLLEEPWEIRRFHLWYMEVAKAGLRDFIVKVPVDYFNLTDDQQIDVDFHDMHRLLRRKDLNVAQVTLFAL